MDKILEIKVFEKDFMQLDLIIAQQEFDSELYYDIIIVKTEKTVYKYKKFNTNNKWYIITNE